MDRIEPALNQILFGPPGTGKTYATVRKAVEILSPAIYAQNRDDTTEARRALKDEFERLASDAERRIRFVTFHQSFSYEDFVEGIRAGLSDTEEDTEQPQGLNYSVEPGVFKQICVDARRSRIAEARFGVSSTPKVWKLSIEEAFSDGSTRRYCFEHGEARIGWPKVGDLRTGDFENNPQLGSKEKSSLRNFGVKIQPGDIVVCLKTVKTIQAVGVVTGPYEYDPTPPDGVRKDYVNKLPVRWLAKNIDVDITAINANKQLTLQTVYRLGNMTWPDIQRTLREKNVTLAGQTELPTQDLLPYMLIIDEINRGNISRIFGELITLIEPSKRDGSPERLDVTLPYSKERFSVPGNVYILGTMNTADRSLAGMDVALRRRFVFEQMMPRPELLDGVLVREGNVEVDVGQLLRVLNERITALLDREHQLGHAYFMPLRDAPTRPLLVQIFRQQVLPLLQEYFFDDWERIGWVLDGNNRESPRFLIEDGRDFAELFGDHVNMPQRRQSWRINEAAFDTLASFAATAAVLTSSVQAKIGATT